MDCLKCPNYWQDNADESKCDKCGAESTFADFYIEYFRQLPPLIIHRSGE